MGDEPKITGYGASRNQETGKWVIYQMPGAVGVGVECSGDTARDLVLSALRATVNQSNK